MTLIYKRDDFEQQIKTEIEFANFMIFFSKQVGIAWNKLQENITIKIQERIDQETGFSSIIEETKSQHIGSKIEDLIEISKIVAEEFGCDLCCFFLKKENTLDLVASNIPIEEKLSYFLNDEEILSVNSFINDHNFRIFGKSRVDNIADEKKITIIEKAVKSKIQTKLLLEQKKYYKIIFIEHWLSVVLKINMDKVGLIKLFQIKGINDLSKKNEVVTNPFSEFETGLLEQIQKHVYNIIKTHQLYEEVIRHRIEDMRTVLHQVIAPLNALMQHCNNIRYKRITEEKVPEKLQYIAMQAKLSAMYARNFQQILDLETRKIHLNITRIRIKAYLIGFL